MIGIDFDLRNETMQQTLSGDVVRSSEIEEETLVQDQVGSSIVKRLNLEIDGLIQSDRHVDGVSRCYWMQPKRISSHGTRSICLVGRPHSFRQSEADRIGLRRWRGGPMMVVSGLYGRGCLHSEVPDAERLDREMARLLSWFNQSSEAEPVIHAAITHL